MKINLTDIPDPGGRYELGDLLGYGVYGKVYSAVDNQASKKKVAVKCQKYQTGSKEFVEEEYRILRDFSNHANVVDFYGIFKKNNEIWFVLEPCDGGSVIDLVKRLFAKNRRMVEEHIAYVIKETLRGLIHLHENKIVHRDVKGSNILLTKEGEIKLSDFGLSKIRSSSDERMSVILGSPSWMAPELVNIGSNQNELGYNDKVDVWSLGITAIELGDGKAPFQDMHPSRTLFQIVANPPPALQKISNWTENFHDFISECLVKDHEYRPCVMELIEHPFLSEIPDNNYHLTIELKSLINDLCVGKPGSRKPDVVVHGKFLKRDIDGDMEPIYEEDLAAIHPVTERDILEILERRMETGEIYVYIGDILLSLNPNERKSIYGNEFHQKYQFKSRSDNPPHIYAIADNAYQNALHHKMVQQIVLSGESGSGKTTNYLHLVDHLLYLGENTSVSSTRIQNTIKLIHSFMHATTPSNIYSTRSVFKTELNYGKTGKISGASFKVHCIEKSRISLTEPSQSNFHIFYYIYDGLVASSSHEKYYLKSHRNYSYLKTSNKLPATSPKDDIDANRAKHKKICSYLEELQFSEEETSTIHAVIAAILHLGEVAFEESEEMYAVLQGKEEAKNFAKLLEIDEKKICWTLTNYCAVKGGNAYKVKQSYDEAKEARDVLANTLYARLVDYVVGTINNKLSFGKAIFGNSYAIKVLDFFGFECFKQNGFSQLIVNTFNEQLHYHFLQRVFAWELQDLQDENIEFIPVSYYSNKDTLNEILGTPEGLFSVLDDASKKGHGGCYVADNLYNDDKKKIMIYDEGAFTVMHYTGKVTYSCKSMPEKNRDYLAPEIIETLRGSKNPIISTMFTAKLDRTGNLIMAPEELRKTKYGFQSKVLTEQRQYSQIKRMRTQSAVFRSLCIELLKELSVGSSAGGTHFVRCVRTDLKGVPRNFKRELVKHQLRAMAVKETAKIRQRGFSQRISFSEFLRRYKFLAFDFDENVDVTKDNCRLLMIRLKIEGWALGKSKIFLKYYNEEYLSRLYETQVKKIVKIQSILRGFLVKCRMAKKVKQEQRACVGQLKTRRRSSVLTEDEAAEIIQKAYRNAAKRKDVLELYSQLNEKDKNFIRPFAKKWRTKSLFSVLMRYRGKRIQDFFNLSQQVHLYNMDAYHKLLQTQDGINLDQVDKKAQISTYLNNVNNSVLKLYFRLEDIPFYNTTHMSNLLTNIGEITTAQESWDSPYKWRESRSQTKEESTDDDMETNEALSNLKYSREPDEDVPTLASPAESEDGKDMKDNINETTRTKINKLDGIKGFEERNTVQNNRFNVNLRKVDCSSKTKTSTVNFTMNSSPANKDFDYIKPKSTQVKPKYTASPVEELRNIARRDSNASDDDPPFNFQGMLRKTNFRRESLKNAVQTVRKLSLKDHENNIINKLSNGHLDNEAVNGKHCSIEILPGLVMEGVEIEL
ncbi:unnamed protein product [Phyllotreta striolata]|uniref:Neither inactivation nor afterpotential protein C n=1 Tax=Phyllotreta striolata TaxID=444603 RepID=A0A9N9TNK3_PHYSR|nr:unnamed protein product [Phyllotreta striolata]